MKDERKKEFVLRISQANNVEMILIEYEMVLEYIREAKENKEDKSLYDTNTDMAGKCVNELLANLHYEYEPALALKNLYLYMKSRLRDARYNNDIGALDEVAGYIEKLHTAYKEVKDNDNSKPIMENTQTVVAGMTYGKNQTLEILSGNDNRGFFA